MVGISGVVPRVNPPERPKTRNQHLRHVSSRAAKIAQEKKGVSALWSYVVGVFVLSWSGSAAQNLTSYCAMQVWSSFFAPAFLYTLVHHHVLSKVLLFGAVAGPSGEKEAVPAATEVIVPNPESASLEPTTCLSDLVHPGWSTSLRLYR